MSISRDLRRELLTLPAEERQQVKGNRATASG
jgi:hypothetical protein